MFSFSRPGVDAVGGLLQRPAMLERRSQNLSSSQETLQEGKTYSKETFSSCALLKSQCHDFRIPSFPRRRESSQPLESLDTRLRGYDEFTGLAQVLNV